MWKNKANKQVVLKRKKERYTQIEPLRQIPNCNLELNSLKCKIPRFLGSKVHGFNSLYPQFLIQKSKQIFLNPFIASQITKELQDSSTNKAI